MKQVIFLCLLSVTLCFSKPAETQAPAAEANGKPLVDKTKTAQNLTEAQTTPKVVVESTPITNLNNTQAANKTEETTLTTNSSNQSTNDTEKHKEASIKEKQLKENGTAAPPKGTSANTQATNEAKPGNNDTKPDEKKMNNGTQPGNNDTKPDENKMNNGTQPAEPEKPASPSVAPKAADDKVVVQARGFDGPSFMGGIILTLGLLAIGFMGFKYYKNQTERNYHTL